MTIPDLGEHGLLEGGVIGGAEATVLELEDLRVELDSGDEVDDGVSFRLKQGEVLGLVGESASGKTTAATALLAYERHGAHIASGRVILGGRDILRIPPSELRAVRGRLISYVPQDPSMSLNPALRIRTQLTEVLEVHGYGRTAAEREERLREMLNEVLLPNDEKFLARYPHQLSGGQQQRVVLAMAFACQPSVIVLDEPTTGLDVTTQAHILDTVRQLTSTHDVAALYVTHDLAVIAAVADRVAVMYAGRLVEVASREVIFTASRHPYTRRLLAAVPKMNSTTLPEGIPGVAPRPGQRPVGCGFAERCNWASDVCREQSPPLVTNGSEHLTACWRWRELIDELNREHGTETVRSARRSEGGRDAVLTVVGLSASHGERKILHGIDLSVEEGKCLALVGESGSGKTTVSRCIAGLHRGRIEGRMMFRGQDLKRVAADRSRETRQGIQYIFQSPYSSLNPRKTVAQLLGSPLGVFFRLSRAEAEARMIDALAHVALDESVLDRYPDQLSGGERQRVAIARALAAKPTLLICDEVTSSLDVSVQSTIVELLSRLIENTGVAMVFVTHHLALVRAMAEEVAVMSDGCIVETGRTSTVLGAPQAEYTRRLLADTPQIR